jgi:hypothetical protein
MVSACSVCGKRWPSDQGPKKTSATDCRGFDSGDIRMIRVSAPLAQTKEDP